MTEKNDQGKDPAAFEDILFSSDEELAQRKSLEPDPASFDNVEEPEPEPEPEPELEFEDALSFSTEEPKQLDVNGVIPTVNAAKQTDSQQSAPQAPVKKFDEDYSDVVVEDALFASDEELDQALDAPSEEAIKKPVKKAASADPQAASQHTKPVDYDLYIHSDENVTMMQALVAAAPGVAIHAKRLNTSLVPAVDWPVSEAVDDELLQEFQQARQAKQDQKKAEEQALADAPATKTAFIKKLYKGQKSRVDEYLGLNLPAREIDLNFKFAPNISVKELAAILTSNQIQEIFAKKKESLLIVFRKSNKALEAITSRDLSSSKLQHLLDAFYQPFIEKMQAFIASCHKYPSIPLVDERQELAELAVAAMRYLVLAYKQLYNKYYQANNVIYGTKRGVANQTAWRLLELLCLEQQLNTALYRTHHDNASATFNKVLNVLCEYEEDFVYEEQQSLVFNEMLTLQQLFALFHIDLAFDITGISASLHKRLRSYWLQKSALVLPLNAEQLSSAWGDDCWIISHEHSGRARFANSLPIQELPASYIHIEPFLHQIEKDYAQAIDILQKNGLDDLPRLLDIAAFELLSGAEILQILTVLNQQIKSIQKNLRLPRYSSFNKFDVDIDLFSGFQQGQIFFNRLVKECSEAHLGGPAKSQQQSVISSKKKRGGNGGYWDFSLEDDRDIFLQTTESKLCPAIDVGHFLLLVKYTDSSETASKSEQAIPLRVVNIERGVANKVALSAEKLGQECIAVDLKNEQQEILPAFISIQQGRRQLITDMQWRFRSGDKLTMILPNGEEADITIAALLSVSAVMQVFSIF